ncbi:MAG TPA: carbamoyltransferase HypF, partial [Gammaproteobacteria bacterium]|nr:carbamoyltransferase HypF [Gammaproteobacteria bacterium]
ACPACGPRLWFRQGDRIEHGDEALGRAVEALKQGAILAVKGIGGFHLICDAGDEAAVARLRARKQRPAKPFALMGRDLAQIRRHVHVPAEAAELLGDPAAPIVLLDKREDRGLPEVVAPDQACLGFMLPYSPLHRLLLDGLERPVIATSGNVGGLPPCTDNDQALRQLAPVADGFLLHDRAILNRVDDSVARWHRGRMWMLRRARGYAPAPLPMPPGLEAAPDLLALGGELKNTFCLVKQGRAILSQHMGDLKNAETFDDFRHNLSLYARLYAHRPRALAVDRHPDYLSTRLGQSRALETGVPIIEVQHHHAHIAACLAEHGWPLDGGPVIGVALDGIGHGDDGGLWGGEVLRADYRGFTRVGTLRPAPLPGGEQAMRQPWRNLAARLFDGFGEHWREQAPVLAERFAATPVEALVRMLARRQHAPLASSTGRLFDAVAAALGICFERIRYEGEAAIRLEHLAASHPAGDIEPYPYALSPQGDVTEFDPRPLWPVLLEELARGAEAARIARRFHLTVAAGFAALAIEAARKDRLSQVVLTGGVLQNRLLADLLRARLEAVGLSVLEHQTIPANDGGLALGQAVIAAATCLNE